MSFKQAERMKEVPMSKLRAIFYECIELEDEGMEVTALTLGEPDFDTPQYIKEACKEALDRGFTKYADNMGIPELREAVAQKLRDENGLDYRPGEIMVTTGVAQGMFASLMAFLDPGDEVLVPDPVYLSYADIPKIAQAKVKRYKLLEENDYQIDIEEVESLITDRTKMMVIVSPSNPTGGVLTRDNLEEVSRLAAKHDLLVLSDEIYEKLVYGGTACRSIASFGNMKDLTVICSGMSKTYSMTGWRVGYSAAPLNVAKAMSSIQSHTTSNTNSIAQYASYVALTDKRGEEFLSRMVEVFDRRRKLITELVRKAPLLSAPEPQGAFYIMVNVSATFGKTCDGEKINNSSDFCAKLLEKSLVAVVDGAAFGAPDYVRLSYACGEDDIRKGLDRIAAFTASLK